MTVQQMRSAIKKVYDSHTWRHRVERMPSNQVIAIYRSFAEKGKFEEAKRRNEDKKRYKQITIKEYFRKELKNEA